MAMLSTPAKLNTALAVRGEYQSQRGTEIHNEPQAGLTHDGPEPKELSPRAGGYILYKRARLFPVSEADARSARYASKVDDQAEDDQENNE